MKPTRREFLKIMAPVSVVAFIPIPISLPAAVPKPWPAGEPRMVFFKMRMVSRPRPEGKDGITWDLAKDVVDAVEQTIVPMVTIMICSAVVASQEEMDLIEQQEGFRGWVPHRELQLTNMANFSSEDHANAAALMQGRTVTG